MKSEPVDLGKDPSHPIIAFSESLSLSLEAHTDFLERRMVQIERATNGTAATRLFVFLSEILGNLRENPVEYQDSRTKVRVALFNQDYIWSAVSFDARIYEPETARFSAWNPDGTLHDVARGWGHIGMYGVTSNLLYFRKIEYELTPEGIFVPASWVQAIHGIIPVNRKPLPHPDGPESKPF